MAKLTDPAVPYTTTIAPTDISYVVLTPGGTPAQRKITEDNRFIARTGNKNLTAYASLSAAITAIGSSQATIEIPAATTVSASLTIPANVTLLLIGTGIISVSASQTLTINGPLVAALRQVFTGSGLVICGDRIEKVYSQWFGAVANTIVATGSMTAGSSTFTATTSVFTSTAVDGGKIVDVNSAGAADSLLATVVTRNSATSITVSTPASFSTTGQTLTIGGRTVTDAVTTAGSATVTSATASFQTYDVDRVVTVTNAGAKNKVGTIVSVTSATVAVLSFTATGAATTKQIVFGTDDAAGISKALASLVNGGVLHFPKGKYLANAFSTYGTFTAAFRINMSNIEIRGDGLSTSLIYAVGIVKDTTGSYFSIFYIASGSHIKFTNIGLLGTNALGQGDTGTYTVHADGVTGDNTATISDVRVDGCRFDSCWHIGFHLIGSSGTTDVSITNSIAQYNGAGGFNPSHKSGLVFRGNQMNYNFLGGLECSANDMAIEGNIARHTSGTGFSIGGFADPQIGDSCTFNGNVAEYNQNGAICGPNMQGLTVSGNTFRLNYWIGLTYQDQSGRTLAKFNKFIGNTVTSNGGTNANGYTGLYINASNATFESNSVYDEGRAGYQQAIGIFVSSGTGIRLIRNISFGQSIADYYLNASTSVFLDQSLTGLTYSIDATATVTYPPDQGFKIVTFSATPTFNVNLGSTQKITLTANVTSSTLTNGVDGQIFTFIIVQDSGSARTFVFPTNVFGATTIGTTLGGYNVQSFKKAGSTWLAVAPGVINQ